MDPQPTNLPDPPATFRFSLRTLFCVLAGFAIASALFRSLLHADPSFFLGIGAFAFGGAVAIASYAFVGYLVIPTTTTTRGHYLAEAFAAAVAALVWIGLILNALHRWPQLCFLQSLLVIVLTAWFFKQTWQPSAGPSPENSLRRLLSTKQSLPHNSPPPPPPQTPDS